MEEGVTSVSEDVKGKMKNRAHVQPQLLKDQTTKDGSDEQCDGGKPEQCEIVSNIDVNLCGPLLSTEK